jgi:hypothetical protein
MPLKGCGSVQPTTYGNRCLASGWFYACQQRRTWGSVSWNFRRHSFVTLDTRTFRMTALVTFLAAALPSGAQNFLTSE